MKAFRAVLYGLTVMVAVAVPVTVWLFSTNGAVWFVAVPLACIIFLDATKTKVNASWPLLLDDIRRSLKILGFLFVWTAALSVILALQMEGGSAALGITWSFFLSNTIEELLFRATLIPLLEMVERRLFDSVNRARVVGVTAAAFGLVHIGGVLAAPSPFFRLVSLHNVAFAIFAGWWLGNVYWRSRNLPSVVALHWWVNLQTRLLGIVAASLF